MMRIGSIFIFLYLLITNTASGQLTNVWYFGSFAGMSFNPQAGNTIPYSVPNSFMLANEGTATICDASGQILFYTNGETVYNKADVVMANGTGLMGHNSAFQGVVIVPVPNNDSIYYIFTADAYEHGFVNGYRYSIVNIRRNGGLGAVISKNSLLYAPSTERLTAARHANGIDIWVITNDLNSNVFRSYLVNCNGLQINPVVSTAGDVLNVHDAMPFGALKVSPDGKQLCQTHFPDFEGTLPENFFQLFDFNNNTGVISNAKKIIIPKRRFYAPEYSPDSKLLYLSKAGDTTLEQVEPMLSSASLVAGSALTIPGKYGFYGLQLAPDNKIYIARSNALSVSVISKPNVKGIGCTVELDKIPLTGSIGLNFPNFINDISFSSAINYTVQDSCRGTVQFFAQSSISGALTYNWDFGDGLVSAQQNPVHTFPSINQFYTVKVKISTATGCGYVERSVTVFPGGISANAVFSFVSKCDSGYIRFVNESNAFPDANIQFEWDFGDGTKSNLKEPVHVFPGSGIYNVKLKLKTGTPCLDDSTTQQLDLQLLDITVTPNQTITIGQSVQLNVIGGATQYQWTPPQWLSDPAIGNPVSKPQNDILYVVEATNDLGCFDIDSVFIKVLPVDSIYMPSGFTPNNDGLNDLYMPIIGLKYTLESFSIYNRWGQKVFFTNQKDKGWNGKAGGLDQGTGVYVWYLTAKNGIGELYTLKGTVLLVR
jgi:gliding motility-associated-like protein